MPVYEYQCAACGRIEEAFQKISEPPLESCPQCQGSLKKIISQSTFHLKGSGWYVTDYGGAKTGTKPGGDTKEKSKTESKKTVSKKPSESASESK